MAISTSNELLDAVRQSRLLEPKQLEEAAKLAAQFADPKQWATELVRRNWLTPWQVNQIAKGRTHDLYLQGYVLLQLLGSGGMGQVYKARHQRLGRLAALKVIRKEYLASPTAVERFHREAQAAARLDHPNIVRVFDAGEASGTHFLSMEYVEGTDLNKLLKERGPLPVGLACDFARQAALGLQHAHEQGMVHRDIKPHNLMLHVPNRPQVPPSRGGPAVWESGVIKILDMGLARLNPAAGGDVPAGLTASGAVMGTPDYIAPEQAMNARTVDIRADIYSLGCTLYHLLTGRLPFGGDSMTEKLIKHQLHEPEPIEKLRPDLPRNLIMVIRKMMAKAPEQRYQTPIEAAQALAAFIPPTGITPVIAPPQRITGVQPAVSPHGETVNEPYQDGRTPGPGGTLAGPEGRPGNRRLMIGLIAGGAAALLLAFGLVLVAGLWWWLRSPSGVVQTATAPATTAKDTGTVPLPVPAGRGFNFDTAQVINVAANGAGFASGIIALPGDENYYKFTAPFTGTLIIRMEESQLSRIDPELFAYSSTRLLLARNDDFGLSLNSQISLNVVAGQTYYLKATGHFATTGAYNIVTRQDIFGVGPGPIPGGPDDFGNDFGTAHLLVLAPVGPTTIRGRIFPSGDSDVFKVTARRTGVMTIRMEGFGGLDSYLVLYDANMQQIAFNDDGAGNLNSLIVWPVTAGQTYYIRARALAISTGDYVLTIDN